MVLMLCLFKVCYFWLFIVFLDMLQYACVMWVALYCGVLILFIQDMSGCGHIVCVYNTSTEEKNVCLKQAHKKRFQPN